MNPDSLFNQISRRFYTGMVDGSGLKDAPGIDPVAARQVPANFLLQLMASACTKTGDALINGKTVLVWLLTSLGAPLAMVAWLVPIREAGSMLPQLFLTGPIKRLAYRKGVWVTGALLQGGAVAGMGLATMSLHGETAGWAVLGGLILFSLARSLCSIAGKDVLGKTIPKKRRGRLTGWSASVAGLMTLLVGAVALGSLRDVKSAAWFAIPLFAAAGLWLLGAFIYRQVREPEGETETQTGIWAAVVKSLSLLKTDPSFARFSVLIRALVLCSALSAPYYVVLARQNGDVHTGILGAFVLAGGLAGAVSSLVWGRLADWSSRRAWQLASGLAALLGILVYLMEHLQWSFRDQSWIYPCAFFVLSIAHSGVRVGRKTYLVDLAGGNKRTDYVAVSNTIIGVILLLTGSLGALSSVWTPQGIILALSLAGLVGVALAFGLPEGEGHA